MRISFVSSDLYDEIPYVEEQGFIWRLSGKLNSRTGISTISKFQTAHGVLTWHSVFRRRCAGGAATHLLAGATAESLAAAQARAERLPCTVEKRDVEINGCHLAARPTRSGCFNFVLLQKESDLAF